MNETMKHLYSKLIYGDYRASGNIKLKVDNSIEILIHAVGYEGSTLLFKWYYE